MESRSSKELYKSKEDLLDNVSKYLRRGREYVSLLEGFLSSLEKLLSSLDDLSAYLKNTRKSPEMERGYMSSSLKKILEYVSEVEKRSSGKLKDDMSKIKYLLEELSKYAEKIEEQKEKPPKEDKKDGGNIFRAIGLTGLILVSIGLFSLLSFSSPTGFFVFSVPTSSIFFIILAVIGVVALVYKLLH